MKLEELKEKLGLPEDEKIKKASGKVKAIVNNAYGFIDDGSGEDIFFQLKDCGDIEVQIDTKLEFEIEITKKGKRATNISTPGGEQLKDKKMNASQNERKYIVPADTFECLKLESRLESCKIENLALQLEKFPLLVSQQGEGKKFIYFRMDKKGNREIDIAKFCESTLRLYKKYSEVLERREKIFQAGSSNSFKLSVDGRMIIGLGSESVYETAMTFHPIYGIPYIPGQALKGIARSWMIKNEIADAMDLDSKDENSDNKLEAKAQKNKLFCYLFGCTKESALGKDYQGCITFLDSYPIDLNKDSLVVDVMNPHYGPYYSDGKPPADYYNPIPVFFLTVENTSFKFVLGLNRRCHKEIDNEKGEKVDILNKAKELLVDALKNQGVGAKTAVGYGYFQDKTE